MANYIPANLIFLKKRMSRWSEIMNEFLETHRLFTTSQAKKAGITKEFINDCKDIVDLGTFPVRTGQKGHRSGTRLEHVYTYSPELAELSRKAKKLSKKPNTDPEQLQDLMDTIEEKARQILYQEKGEHNV